MKNKYIKSNYQSVVFFKFIIIIFLSFLSTDAFSQNTGLKDLFSDIKDFTKEIRKGMKESGVNPRGKPSREQELYDFGMSIHHGSIKYSNKDFKNRGSKVKKGYSIWYQDKWLNLYQEEIGGSFKEDLEALVYLQEQNYNYLDISNADSSSIKHKPWKIDLCNINNPDNLNLDGVKWADINGELRVQELKLANAPYSSIKITKGLEALINFYIFFDENITDLEVILPHLCLFYITSKSLNVMDVEAPNLKQFNVKNSPLNEYKLNAHNLLELSLLYTNVTYINFEEYPKLNSLLYLSNKHQASSLFPNLPKRVKLNK